MLIYPAIDLYEKKAVRLLKGDYQQMTIYNEDPVSQAKDFVSEGASCIHMVDLEGAKTGDTPNFSVVCKIKEETNLFCEIGGGIRSIPVIRKYADAGIDRVILGTAALTDPSFLKEAVKTFGERIAVGIDIRDGKVAIKGWLETSDTDAFTFAKSMQDLGIRTIICTDISRDGAMQGTNAPLYAQLKDRFSMNIIASGGVSSLEDIRTLRSMDLYGAIIGKAYYTGAINLRKAIEAAK